MQTVVLPYFTFDGKRKEKSQTSNFCRLNKIEALHKL